MKALGRQERDLASEIVAELSVLRPGTCAVEGVLESVRVLCRTEAVVLYSVATNARGLELSRFQAVGPRAQQMAPILDAALRCQKAGTIIYYDQLHPPRDQRNRPIEATAWLDQIAPGTFKRSRMRNEVAAPIGYGDHKQPRALLCEGAHLMGWFGVLHPESSTDHQLARLALIVPAMRRRLALERRLDAAPRTMAALAATLELIPMPALIVGPGGRIREHNAAAAALLQGARPEVAAMCSDVAAGRPCRRVEAISLAERGVPRHHLVLIHPAEQTSGSDSRVEQRITDLEITKRQAAVLRLLVRGNANATIAAELGIGERAVEHHVTALLDRVGVDNRASLVAAVLAS